MIIEHKETGDVISATVVQDGGKNAVYLLTGTIKSEDDSVFSIFDLAHLKPQPTNMRLDSIQFAVESGLKAIIQYENKPHAVPLEARGKIDLNWFGGLTGHEMSITFKGVGSFLIVLDISKMGV